MNDVSPEILKKVQNKFNKELADNKTVADLTKAIDSGEANYKDAAKYSEELGKLLGNAYKEITSEDLPNGRMYKNIYDKVVAPTMENNYDMVVEQTTKVQDDLNKKAGIGLKTQVPEMNVDRIKELGFKIAEYEAFEDAESLLQSAAGNFTQSIVDDFIRENADFHYKAGMQPKIVRTAAAGCCKWCADLGGTYLYSEIGKNSDVFHRHQNCNCVVEYNPGDGKIQNVHSKEWRRADERDKIEQRKSLYNSLRNSNVETRNENAIMKPKEYMDKYVGKQIINTDNQSVREWYVANVSNIPNLIDRTQPLEEQARQAFELRNKLKHEARVAMSDKETAEMLEKRRPAPSFDELIERKMKKKGMNKREAIRDILETASKSNEDVNSMFGL